MKKETEGKEEDGARKWRQKKDRARAKTQRQLK